MSKRLSLSLAVCLILAAQVSLGQQAIYTEGQKLEVREGDTWSAATIVKREGRRYLIHYQDGGAEDEWATADRLRPAGTASKGASANSQATPANAEQRSAKSAFAQGDRVEYKRGNRWAPGTVDRELRGWYQVSDAKDKVSYWLEPWAIRLAGAAYDVSSSGSDRQPSAKGESAPTSAPPPAPRQTGDQFMLPGADGAITPLGPFTSISYDGALDPQPGTGKPLSLPTTRPAVEFGSATIRPEYRCVDSIIPCYDTPGTALVVFGLFMDQPAEVVRMDVSTRRQIDKRIVDAPRYRITGAADGGNTVLAVPAEAFPKVMHLLELKTGRYQLKANFRPFTNNFVNIIQSALLSPTRAVVVNTAGEGYVLDLAKAKAVGYLKLKQGTTFYIHPTGQLIGGQTAAGTLLLLWSEDFSIVAEFRDAAGRGNVTVDPSGSDVAYVSTSNVIRIAKIEDGKTISSIPVKADFKDRIELLSTESLLVDYRENWQEHPTVYDVRVGMPLWIYDLPRDTKQAVLANGQVLLAAIEGDMAAVCMATLPDATARNAVKTLSKESFLIAPGTPVQIEGNFAAFGEDAAKAKETVRAAVKAAGLVVSDQPQPFHLTISAARGPTEKRDVETSTWNGISIVQSVTAPSSIVTASLVHQGVTVWSQEIRYQLQAIRLKPDQSLQDAAVAAAQVTAAGLSSLAVPSYVPKEGTLGAPAALGNSELTVRGFSPVARPPVQPTTPARPNIPMPRPRRMPGAPTA